MTDYWPLSARSNDPIIFGRILVPLGDHNRLTVGDRQKIFEMLWDFAMYVVKDPRSAGWPLAQWLALQLISELASNDTKEDSPDIVMDVQELLKECDVESLDRMGHMGLAHLRRRYDIWLKLIGPPPVPLHLSIPAEAEPIETQHFHLQQLDIDTLLQASYTDIAETVHVVIRSVGDTAALSSTTVYHDVTSHFGIFYNEGFPYLLARLGADVLIWKVSGYVEGFAEWTREREIPIPNEFKSILDI